MDNKLTPFENKAIRKIWHDEQWYFSIVDIIEILTESPKPKTYWSMLKKRDIQLVTICELLKMKAADNKFYKTDAANTEGVFRIIMSVPSPKAEPLKLWLAEQGKRSLEETENPELLTERQAELYRAKGYPEEWILRRVQSIETRKQLTDEWKNRGISQDKEFSILTATIAKGTFGITPSEHAQLKDVETKKLRDHMTPMELILTAFSEEATRQIAIRDNAQGYHENHEAAQKGSQIGGDARLNFEKNTGLKVVSEDNFKHLKSGESEKQIEGSETND